MHERNTTRRISMASIAAVFAIVGLIWEASPIRARSADPMFAEDVAPILYRNCAVCHHAGGMGPFSLINYDTAAAHAEEIRDAVAARVMPPWHSTDPRGSFSNDRRLSDDDRNTILRWIDAGAKPGNLNRLPPNPEYAGGWAIGTPDLTGSMLED
jgi:mono/diheme cytochrome c family protein